MTEEEKQIEAKRQVLQKCKDDFLFLGKTVSKNAFELPSPEFHYELRDLMSSERRLAIEAPRGYAKAQSLDSNVLTLNGWKRFGDIKVGDKVIGSDGKPTKVIELHPIGEMELYKVTTRDGRSALCNKEHLWSVQIPQNTKSQKLVTRTLEELIAYYGRPRLDRRTGKVFTENKVYIPTVAPIEFEEKEFLIDPYTLGAWLGDGNSAGGRFTTADEEIVEYFPYEVTKHKEKYNYGILGLQGQLRQLELINNKHIPEEYLFGSIEQREALLQGLIDTDGTIPKNGIQVFFCQKNEILTDDVIALVRSLGGTATKGEQLTRFDKNSEYKHSYRLSIRLPKEIKPARLKRKINRWKGSKKTRSAIVSILKDRTDWGRCITVENEDGLYITDDYLVTHNSTLCVFRVLQHLLFDKGSKYVVIQSKTQKEAKKRLGAIKNIIEYSQAFRDLFGYMGEQSAKTWTQDTIVLANGDTIEAKGYGQPVRGGLTEDWARVTMYYLDDPEDEDNTKTKDAMEGNLKKFLSALPGIKKKTGRVIVVGTPINQACLVEKLRKMGGWTFKHYQAVNEKTK